jgi:hypothetical protein
MVSHVLRRRLAGTGWSRIEQWLYAPAWSSGGIADAAAQWFRDLGHEAQG